MWNLIKIIFILLLVIGFLFFALSYYFEKKLSKTDLPSSQKNLLQLESLLPKEEEKEREIQYLDFYSSDKKLKFTYLSDWIETKDEKISGNIFSKEIAEKYNLKVLFLALKTKEQDTFQLVASEGIFSDQENLENIVNIIEENRKKGGWEKENINSEMENNEDIFEAKYKRDNVILHLKERVILLIPEEGEIKTYFVTLSSPEENWQNLKDEAEKIISSIQIIN